MPMLLGIMCKMLLFMKSFDCLRIVNDSAQQEIIVEDIYVIADE